MYICKQYIIFHNNAQYTQKSPYKLVGILNLLINILLRELHKVETSFPCYKEKKRKNGKE